MRGKRRTASFFNTNKTRSRNIPSTSKNISSGSTGIPDDIAQIGEPIKQVFMDSYPKGDKNRAFVADWFKRYKWLQYSVKKDAAFCYPCQQFLPHGSKQTSYTVTGFRNWKNATDSKCMRKQYRIFKQCLYVGR